VVRRSVLAEIRTLQIALRSLTLRVTALEGGSP